MTLEQQDGIQGSGVASEPKNGTTSIGLSTGAREALREMSEHYGITQRELVGLLINYAYSIYRRPGSWEASAAFDLHTYTRSDSVADKWFKV